MTIETNKFRLITPADGCILVNHKERVASDKVYLGVNADVSGWAEVTVGEAEALRNKWEKEATEQYI